MFINCPHCAALIATDPATDLPPPRCPRCAATLRPDGDPPPPGTPMTDAPAVPDAGAGEIGADAAATSVDARGEGPVDIGHALPPDAPSTLAANATPAASHPEAAAPVARVDRSAAPSPSFARARRAPTTTPARRWPMPAAITSLVLLLAVQWLVADRERLAADARLRPYVAGLCGVLRCSVPAWREPSAFVLLHRDVRPHPTVPGALRVAATLRNDARWPQAWPRLRLGLSDVEGREIASRAFDAAEYLGAPPTQEHLASGQAASIRFDVREPAPGIVSFAFEFE